MTVWKKVVPPSAPKTAANILKRMIKGMAAQMEQIGDEVIITVTGLDSCNELNLEEWESGFKEISWVKRVDVGTVDETLAASIGCRSYCQFSILLHE